MKKYKRQPLKKQSIRFADESKRSGFVNAPNSLIKSPYLSIGAKMVYLLLHSYAWDGDKCYPGHNKIAAELGFKSPKTVRKYLNELRNYMLIDWQGKSELNTNLYEIKEIPAILLSDSKQSQKLIAERIVRLNEKHEKPLGLWSKGGVKKVPEGGVKKVPESNTQENNTQGVFLDSSLDHEASKSTEAPPFVRVGPKRSASGKAGTQKARKQTAYIPLTELEVYELAKKYTIHPEDVKEVAQSAIDEFEAGNIIKPTNTYETTVSYLNFRVSNGYIEKLHPMYEYVVEDCHPLNRAQARYSRFADRVRDLKQQKEGYLELKMGLLNGPLPENRTPRFLLILDHSAQLAAVEDRIQEVNEEGKKFSALGKESYEKVLEMIQQFPERQQEYLSKC